MQGLFRQNFLYFCDTIFRVNITFNSYVLNLDKSITLHSPSNDGTNCCSFLALKIVEAWHLDIQKTMTDWNVFAIIVEEIIEDFPRKINPFRDISLHYDVAEAKNILSKHSLIKDVEINILPKNNKVLSNESREDMEVMETVLL